PLLPPLACRARTPRRRKKTSRSILTACAKGRVDRGLPAHPARKSRDAGSTPSPQPSLRPLPDPPPRAREGSAGARRGEEGARVSGRVRGSRPTTAMALLRSVATIGSYTLLSRVFGFIRDVLTAAILGAGPVADAFFVAQRLPNLFRSLFAEGAFSAAFVPLFAGTAAEQGKEAARVFAEDALAVLLAALLGFVLLGEIFMPTLMSVIAPGFGEDPAKFGLAVDLARITFPYLLFIALVALQGGVLNSVDRFAAAAATPGLLNLFLIAALLMMDRFSWHDGRALAWAVTGAGLAQFLWLLSSCARAGLALRLPMPRLTAGVRRTLAVMAPGTIGAGVTQLNLLVSTALASLLPGGSVSYLYYADRL